MTTSVASCWPATARRPATASTRTRLPTPCGEAQPRTQPEAGPTRRDEQGQREGHDAERRADAEDDEGAVRDLVDRGRGVGGERAVGEVGRDDDEARQQRAPARRRRTGGATAARRPDDADAVERDLDREDPQQVGAERDLPAASRPEQRRRRSGRRRARPRRRGARARRAAQVSSADAVASAPARSPRASAPATRGTATAASTPPAAISKSTLGTALTDW